MDKRHEPQDVRQQGHTWSERSTWKRSGRSERSVCQIICSLEIFLRSWPQSSSAGSTKKVCEREETLAGARETGTDVDSPDAEAEMAAESMVEEKLQRRRRRGDPQVAGAALLSQARDEGRGDGVGDSCPVSVGRALFHGENWLGRAGVPA